MIGFDETLGVTVETTAVRVLRPLSFVAAATTITEGADDVELHIGVPLGHVGMPLEIDLRVGGTALLGSDYTLVATDTSSSVRITATDTVTLQLGAVPDTLLKLLLRPRGDRISQGDRRAELRISGYRVAGEERQSVILPAALGVTILDDDLPVVQRLLGVGTGVACARLNGDTVRCWQGANIAAELRPVLASAAIHTARQLAFGEKHVCWLQQDRRVACAGRSDRGQSDVPPDFVTAVSVAAGREHSCGVDEDGTVHCWGRNGDGQSSPPEDLNPVLQLSLGRDHSCALQGDNSVRCWGYGGDGRTSPPEDLGPVVQLALGYDHSCALQRDGQVRCWGDDGDSRASPPDDLGAGHATGFRSQPQLCVVGSGISALLGLERLGPAGSSIAAAWRSEGNCRRWGQQLRAAGGRQRALLGRRIGERCCRGSVAIE